MSKRTREEVKTVDGYGCDVPGCSFWWSSEDAFAVARRLFTGTNGVRSIEVRHACQTCVDKLVGFTEPVVCFAEPVPE